MVLTRQGVPVLAETAEKAKDGVKQDAEYKEAVLPAAVKARVSVEAGVAMPWYKYLGSYGKPVSIEQFGLQGDGAQNMIDLGITAEHVVEAAKASIAEVEAAK